MHGGVVAKWMEDPIAAHSPGKDFQSQFELREERRNILETFPAMPVEGKQVGKDTPTISLGRRFDGRTVVAAIPLRRSRRYVSVSCNDFDPIWGLFLFPASTVPETPRFVHCARTTDPKIRISTIREYP